MTNTPIKNAVFNPHNQAIDTLPTIYGFLNGSNDHGCIGALLAEDGTALGGHCSSAEGYLQADLGIPEGYRLDRHKDFQKHYPNGYKMEFVLSYLINTHEGLLKAIALNHHLSKENIK
jgi:hypothetical protein